MMILVDTTVVNPSSVTREVERVQLGTNQEVGTDTTGVSSWRQDDRANDLPGRGGVLS